MIIIGEQGAIGTLTEWQNLYPGIEIMVLGMGLKGEAIINRGSGLNNNEYDNKAVSKFHYKFYFGFAILFSITLGPAIILLNIFAISLYSFDFIIIQFILSVIVILLYVSYFKYITICPTSIILNENEMILIRNNRNNIKVEYTADIIHFVFSYHSYDQYRKPTPRWMIGWKKGFITRIINLTEPNARKLAEILDKNQVKYVWDEHRRKAWEQKNKISGLSDTPE
jgi:hypothetical protein